MHKQKLKERDKGIQILSIIFGIDIDRADQLIFGKGGGVRNQYWVYSQLLDCLIIDSIFIVGMISTAVI